MKLAIQILLPVLVLGGSAAIAAKMIASMEKPKVIAPQPRTPLVRVLDAKPGRVEIDVRAQGVVEAATSVTLSAQVAGRIRAVSDRLRAGEFFAAGETLVQIDDSDYLLALVQADAAVKRAELRLAQERAEAEVSKRAWEQLESDRKPDALATRELFVAEASAALAAAKAQQRRAQLDLQRTLISLPFAGRVRSTSADVGQYVAPGQALAQVYGTDFVEVRLPIPDEDAAFLDLARGPNGERTQHEVTLTADFAGRVHEWKGTIVRAEGEIDRRTRQVTLIASVAAPFDDGGDPLRQPLSVGMFVDATIRGRAFDNVLTLPRSAVRADNTILVLDIENRLHARSIRVLRKERDVIHVEGGLEAGERVAISPIETFIDGMPVQVLTDDGDAATAPKVAPQEGAKR
jgi:RND family efflux transporter MFP subunit